jgi:hypothetical protein
MGMILSSYITKYTQYDGFRAFVGDALTYEKCYTLLFSHSQMHILWHDNKNYD